MIVAVNALGCESKLKVHTAGSGKSGAQCGQSANQAIDSSACPPLVINDVSQIVITPGKPTLLRGNNFRSSLQAVTRSLNLAEELPVVVNVLNPNEAQLTLPEGIGYGPLAILLTQDGQTAKLTVFSDGGKTDYPVITADPSLICASTQFYDANGNLRQGAKSCRGEIPACERDGEQACVTSADFPAAAKQAIDPAHIKAGSMIAGIAGNLPSCDQDGAVACIASQEFPAANKLQLADKVVTGKTVAGIVGTVTLPLAQDVRAAVKFGPAQTLSGSLPNCTVDGETGCVAAGPTYKAASITELASKILIGKTVAGVSGNVTLPAVGKVLKDIPFGVSGTSLKGSLTLPLASNVISAAPNYGDPAGLLTPSFNPETLPIIIARPGTPSITRASIEFNPNNITLEWTATTGATGYLVLMRRGAAVSSTPSDFASYSENDVLGDDQVIYVGSATSVTYSTSVNAGLVHYFAVYAYETNKVYSASPATKTMFSCAGLAGGRWIPVPGDSDYGTSGFCVQKYLPTNVNSLPISQHSVTPWLSISQSLAKSTCAGLGPGYHLITNPEWMTIAANLANTGSNWSDGTVGEGTLSRGHSDANPNSVCPADEDDSKAWVDDSCTGQLQGEQSFTQRRTQNLSNGEIIWDFAGNAQQFVDYLNIDDKPEPQGNQWYELDSITPSPTTPLSHIRPTKEIKTWWDDSWNSAQAIGKIFPFTDGLGGALARGGSKGDAASAGYFAFHLLFSSVQTPGASSATSFRCAWKP